MKTFSKALFATVAAVLILGLIAEVGLRWYMTSQITNQYREQAAAQGTELTEEPEVSFGSSPLILGLVRGSVPQMRMTLPETLRITPSQDSTTPPSVSGNPALDLTAKKLDISHPQAPVAGHLEATTLLTDEFLLATIQQAMAQQEGQSAAAHESFAQSLVRQLVRVTDVTSDATDGTFDIEFTSGAAVLTMQPKVENGGLTFAIVGTSLLGVELPKEISEQIGSALSDSVDGSMNLDAPLTIEAFDIVDGGARVKVSGNDVPLSDVNHVGVPGSHPQHEKTAPQPAQQRAA
ncbi:LmeA family phospholipid-binding protein [Corynebacterium atypicum]|uniref:LmeA family phospholipid-binding protein n=1 Tax=Corynebacterium atypicum TaxID=191610 RepID=UPI0006915E6A|nr:DUF2993 domain-containing protein [Corynebacterium atypicum]